MNRGFTLIEILVSITLVFLAVLSSSRILVFVLDQTRGSTLRFHQVEGLDYYKNYLSSLPLDSAELAEGLHGRKEEKLRINWQVEDAGAFLKRVRLVAGGPHGKLSLVLYRARFIKEIRP